MEFKIFIKAELRETAGRVSQEKSSPKQGEKISRPDKPAINWHFLENVWTRSRIAIEIAIARELSRAVYIPMDLFRESRSVTLLSPLLCTRSARNTIKVAAAAGHARALISVPSLKKSGSSEGGCSYVQTCEREGRRGEWPWIDWFRDASAIAAFLFSISFLSIDFSAVSVFYFPKALAFFNDTIYVMYSAIVWI